MGLGRRRRGSPQLRQWLGNLLVAWTFVTGLAVVFASALYQRTGDLKILISYLGAPFLIGTALFVLIGVFGLAAREKPREMAEPLAAPRRRQESIFGRGGLSPGEQSWSMVNGHILVRVRPTFDDALDVARAGLERRHAWSSAGVVALAGAIGWARVVAPGTVDGLAPLVLLTGGVAFLGTLLGQPRRVARRTPYAAATYRFGPEGIEYADGRRTGRHGWDEVVAARETKRVLHLRMRGGEDVVVPKRDIGSEIVLERLRVLAGFSGAGG